MQLPTRLPRIASVQQARAGIRDVSVEVIQNRLIGQASKTNRSFAAYDP